MISDHIGVAFLDFLWGRNWPRKLSRSLNLWNIAKVLPDAATLGKIVYKSTSQNWKNSLTWEPRPAGHCAGRRIVCRGYRIRAFKKYAQEKVQPLDRRSWPIIPLKYPMIFPVQVGKGVFFEDHLNIIRPQTTHRWVTELPFVIEGPHLL